MARDRYCSCHSSFPPFFGIHESFSILSLSKHPSDASLTVNASIFPIDRCSISGEDDVPLLPPQQSPLDQARLRQNRQSQESLDQLVMTESSTFSACLEGMDPKAAFSMEGLLTIHVPGKLMGSGKRVRSSLETFIHSFAFLSFDESLDAWPSHFRSSDDGKTKQKKTIDQECMFSFNHRTGILSWSKPRTEETQHFCGDRATELPSQILATGKQRKLSGSVLKRTLGNVLGRVAADAESVCCSVCSCVWLRYE